MQALHLVYVPNADRSQDKIGVVACSDTSPVRRFTTNRVRDIDALRSVTDRQIDISGDDLSLALILGFEVMNNVSLPRSSAAPLSTGNHADTGPAIASSSMATSVQTNQAFEALKPRAKQVYEKERLYHGTDKDSGMLVREQGFRIANKTASTEVPEQPHHYLTGDKSVASGFAGLGSQRGALVRTIGAHTNKHAKFEPDPFMRDPKTLRTKDDIKPKHVLGSKRSPPRMDAQVFQRRLKDAGTKVDRDTAGRLLRDVQSDSEDDFK